MKKVLFTTQGETPGYTPEFLGRNGGGKMMGILLSHAVGNMARLWPIRKNGVEGRSMLSIPVQEIPALIEALQAFHAEHAPAPIPVPEPEHSEVDGSNQKLALKVGKKYIDRSEQIVTIISEHPGHDYKFLGKVAGYTRTYMDNGLWMGTHDTPHDLIAEYKEETP